jgi:hypothetical protein
MASLGPDPTRHVRPNGQPYRARKPPRAVGPLEGNTCVPSAVYVLGTRDEPRARALAARLATLDDSPPEAGWYRIAMVDGDRVMVSDDRRGAPGLMFEVVD